MLAYAIINWDITTLPDFADAAKVLSELKNESLVTPVRPYAEDISFTKEEHKKLHSAIPGSTIDFPHSFILHPIHLVAGDYESEIVAWYEASMYTTFFSLHRCVS